MRIAKLAGVEGLAAVVGLVVDDVCADDEVTTRPPALDASGLAQSDRV